jgi:peptidoglycan/xylan/chitin deacetylase (PgdA/CDA1 family)
MPGIPKMEPNTTQLLPSYHLVLPEPSRYVYSTRTREFGNQLELIGKVRSLFPGDCALTFDDCHVSQFRYAFPLLERYGLRARFFAIAGWMGKRPDYMTWQQLKELVAAGHEIQSHTFSHRPLIRCAQAELAEELSSSRCELEQKLGVAVHGISVPFGRWDRRVIDSCARAGYRRVYTSDPAAPARVGGIDVLGRFIVRRSTSLAQLRRVLTGHRLELRWLRTKQNCTLLARASVGERAYFMLWDVLRSRKHLHAASRICGAQVESQ